jgi:uncharacterized iron-regulated membrane protein
MRPVMGADPIKRIFLMTTTPDDDIDPELTVEGPDTGPPDPQPRRSWRPLLLRVHFYAGVCVAPFILIAAITGSLYAIAPTVERVIYADVLSVASGGKAQPIRDQVKAAQEAAPGLTLTGLRPPASATDSTRVHFADPALGEDTVRAVFVDPYTTKVLGSQESWFGFLPFSTWLTGFTGISNWASRAASTASWQRRGCG